MGKDKNKEEAICQFCGEKIGNGRKGIQASESGLYICESCIKKSYDVVTSNDAFDGMEYDPDDDGRMTPKKIKEILDESVIGQDEAKITLAIAVYNHYKRLDMETDVKFGKSNVMLIGPTGSGKTLLAQSIADMLDVPFAIADCTTLTEAGFVGDDVENVLLKLLQAADYDLEKAQRGIVFLDEVDKIAKINVGASITKDPSGEGVQQGLLKIIEGTVSNISARGGRKNPQERCIQFNTENVLFICGGAFPGLSDIINKRLSKGCTSIGFGGEVGKANEKAESEALKHVATEDLVQYGFIPEFIGRVPVVVSLEELNEDAMVKVLTEPKDCLVNQYKEFFRYDGVELEFTDEAIREIAKETMKKKTGARGLRGIMEHVLKELMYVIPSETDVRKCIVGSGCVGKKEGAIQLVRETKEVRQAC